MLKLILLKIAGIAADITSAVITAHIRRVMNLLNIAIYNLTIAENLCTALKHDVDSSTDTGSDEHRRTRMMTDASADAFMLRRWL